MPRSDAWAELRVDAIVLGTLLGDHRKMNRMSLAEVCQDLDPSFSIKLDAPTLSRIERGQVVPTEDQGQALTTWALQSLPGIDAPVARRTDPETSHEAAESVKPITITVVREAILRYLASFAGKDYMQRDIYGSSIAEKCIDEGIYEHLTVALDIQVSASGARTRRKELVEAGLVKDSGYIGATRGNRRSIAWAITSLGQEALTS